jgi:hypothetical protein
MHRYILKQLVPAFVLLTLSCGGDDPFSPTVQNVAGSYQATTLTATESGITTNLLQLGATIEIVLNENGTTTGRLFAPGLDEGGGDVDVDLVGTWTLNGDTVTFEQEGDSFIPQVPFVAGRNQLRGEDSIGTVLVRITLTKE